MQDFEIPTDLLPVIDRLRQQNIEKRGCPCPQELIGWADIERLWDTLPMKLRAQATGGLEQVEGDPEKVYYIWHDPNTCPIARTSFADLN